MRSYFLSTCFLGVAFQSCFVCGDIFTSEGVRIEGTEGITPGPGVQLDNRNLEFARLSRMDLSGGNFANSNLRFSWFTRTTLTNSNFHGANLENANMRGADLENANLTGAILENAYLRQARFMNANLTGVNLSNTNMRHAILNGANLTDAWISGADITDLKKEQLISTASYKNENLQETRLSGDFSAMDFRGHNLTNSDFSGTVANADFSNANLDGARFAVTDLTDATFEGAMINGTQFVLVTSRGFTKEQLYETASYTGGNLTELQLTHNDLTGWDFTRQNLTGADFFSSNLTNSNLENANLAIVNFGIATLSNANLKGVNLANARFDDTTIGLDAVIADGTTTYNQWTAFPNSFSPEMAGWTFIQTEAGDFDGDEQLNGGDVDILARGILGIGPRHLPDGLLDVNQDNQVNNDDIAFWVVDIKNTWFGDANLDGEFNSSDLVSVFSAGEYDDDVRGNSTWATGDWNSDSEFSSTDFVFAFQSGGYQQGPRKATSIVPEPHSLFPLFIGSFAMMVRRRHSH